MPQDMSVMAKLADQTYYLLQIAISEPNGCKNYDELSDERRSLFRIYHQTSSGTTKVFDEELKGFNPICYQESPWLYASYDKVKFKCLYQGSYSLIP